jgi:hypothetical protein
MGTDLNANLLRILFILYILSDFFDRMNRILINARTHS